MSRLRKIYKGEESWSSLYGHQDNLAAFLTNTNNPNSSNFNLENKKEVLKNNDISILQLENVEDDYPFIPEDNKSNKRLGEELEVDEMDYDKVGEYFHHSDEDNEIICKDSKPNDEHSKKRNLNQITSLEVLDDNKANNNLNLINESTAEFKLV